MPAYKYQTKDGKTKWYANFYYTDWLGEKKHKCKRGFTTKREALEYERTFLDKGSKEPTILFSSLIENYLSEMETRLKPTTLSNKRFLIDSKLIPFFGTMRICDIDAITIRRWQNNLINYTDENGDKFSETYLRTINNQLSAVLNYAVKYYKLPSNPCKIAGTMGKSRADEMNIWTQEEFEYFIGFEKKTAYRLAFNLLFYSGIREGELLALTPADVLNEPAISISKNFAVLEGDEYFLTPKTEKGSRIVSLPQSLHDELLRYIKGVYIEDHERIFYFQKSGLTAEFKRATKNSGMQPIRVHDLRHSHASMLIHMKVDIKEIADRLGHESPQTTWETYAHLYPGQDQILAGKLDEMRTASKEAHLLNQELFCKLLIHMGGKMLSDFSGSEETSVSLDQLTEIYNRKPFDEIRKLEPVLNIYYKYANIGSL